MSRLPPESNAPGFGEPDPAPLGGIEIAPGVRVGGDVLRLSYSRSAGPGGQNVNKLSTKAELRVWLRELPIPHRALARLRAFAGSRVTDAGELLLVAQSERSQTRNREICLEKLRELVVRAMVEPKVRRKTKPSRGSVERRIREKKSRSQVKRDRRGEE
jgi:ribosome-associated protein